MLKGFWGPTRQPSGQSAFCRHSTQACDAGSQNGFGPFLQVSAVHIARSGIAMSARFGTVPL